MRLLLELLPDLVTALGGAYPGSISEVSTRPRADVAAVSG